MGLGEGGVHGVGVGLGGDGPPPAIKAAASNWKRTACARDEERAAPLGAGSQSIIAALAPGPTQMGPRWSEGPLRLIALSALMRTRRPLKYVFASTFSHVHAERQVRVGVRAGLSQIHLNTKSTYHLNTKSTFKH